jgi:hypothetical protein
MAKRTSLLKTGAKKKPAPRTPRFADEKFTGSEPQWANAAELDEAQLRNNELRGYFFYNYHMTVGDMRKHFVEYVQKFHNWSKEDLRALAECDDSRIGITICSYAKMKLNGAPLKETPFVQNKLADLLAHGRDKLELKLAKEVGVSPKRTVQDHMNDKFSDIVGELESWWDAATEGNAYPEDMVAWMREQNVPQAFVNRITAYYAPIMSELEAAKAKGADEQLKTAYAHYDKARVKRVTDFYSKLTAALRTYGQVKKAVRKARVKKPVSKEKLAKKVKYCTEDTTLNLVSVNSVDIIGAQVLWVYNRKTRKLGKYVADVTAGQLSIKGTAIIGFDTAQSIAKTIRKPELQLKQFMGSGKVALRTFLDSVKATPVKLNGRLNQDTLLLKTQHLAK